MSNWTKYKATRPDGVEVKFEVEVGDIYTHAVFIRSNLINSTSWNHSLVKSEAHAREVVDTNNAKDWKQASYGLLFLDLA